VIRTTPEQLWAALTHGLVTAVSLLLQGALLSLVRRRRAVALQEWSHRRGSLWRQQPVGPAQGLLVPAVRVLAKEAHHLRRGVRALGVAIRAAWTPPRPGMAHLVDNPLLHEDAPVWVVVDGAGVGIPTRHLPPFNPQVLVGP